MRDTSGNINYYCYYYLSLLLLSTGGNRSSWRITVRQLESMIRLSEAMARIYCSETVLPKHVQEAFRLLNKSIIRVETPEINFESEESSVIPIPEGEEEGEGEGDREGMTDHTNGESDRLVKPAGRKIRVTYEQYRTIANLLILHLRRLEEKTEEEGRRSL